MIDIKSMLLNELETQILSMGEKKYRALQIFTWLHKGVCSFEEMTDLPPSLRETLNNTFYITKPKLISKQVSKDKTVKYLWGIGGHTSTNTENSVECVLLEYKHGITICISTQIGCKMNCIFCASAKGGFIRNLAVSEILDQILFSVKDSGKRISNVVLMGMGEPLDNYDNVIRFISLICHDKGLNIGARHVTLSTCGIIENIDRLSACGVKLSLAISLHAPDDETRSKIVPYNRNTGVKALLNAARRYADATGRRVTFEYVMISGINDSKEHARKLAKELKNTGSLLNLIQLSPVHDCDLQPSRKEDVEAFAAILSYNGIDFTTRRSLGADIEAACGQLRRKSLKSNGFMGNN